MVKCHRNPVTVIPALLEILLLQRFKMTAASRYTVTTLTTYVVVAVGLMVALGTLGARWSQVQWLAAALSVGIGFGLQEIVANFISGLIILFGRPIRVGDTDGVVTKIKIRATTIRNWDGKELLVPNKEFITGRLLNWSLSDQTTRLVLAIGIAYGSPVRQAMELLEEAAHERNFTQDPRKHTRRQDRWAISGSAYDSFAVGSPRNTNDRCWPRAESQLPAGEGLVTVPQRTHRMEGASVRSWRTVR